MSKKEIESKMRQASVGLLERRGFAVHDVSSGSGVPKLSRLELDDGSALRTCIAKFTTSGRIHFVRENEKFKVLSDFDLVLHIYATSYDANCVQVTLFTRETVEKAFERAFDALEKDGQEHIPIWLNPKLEDGVRFTGSGFGSEALWSEEVTITLAVAEQETTEADITDAEIGIMDRVKLMLAEHMSVSPDMLEIDVRVKI